MWPAHCLTQSFRKVNFPSPSSMLETQGEIKTLKEFIAVTGDRDFTGLGALSFWFKFCECR